MVMPNVRVNVRKEIECIMEPRKFSLFSESFGEISYESCHSSVGHVISGYVCDTDSACILNIAFIPSNYQWSLLQYFQSAKFYFYPIFLRERQRLVKMTY